MLLLTSEYGGHTGKLVGRGEDDEDLFLRSGHGGCIVLQVDMNEGKLAKSLIVGKVVDKSARNVTRADA